LPASNEASKARNEGVDDSSMPSLLTPLITPEFLYDQDDHYTPAQSPTFPQCSEDKSQTTEPPVQPPTHIRPWQPGSLPPLFPSLAAYVPSLTPQGDWPFQDDAIGLDQGSEGWVVDRAHLSPSTLGGHRGNNLFDIE
jgi:hypothetical protein